MNRKQIIAAFLARSTRHATASSLSILGDKLYSYRTVIAQWYGEELLLNRTKYSMTTSRQQNELVREARRHVGTCFITEIGGNVDIGTDDLKPYVVQIV